MSRATGEDAWAHVVNAVSRRWHFPLAKLQLCLDCHEVSLLGEGCPGCGARGQMLTLATVMDRRSA